MNRASLPAVPVDQATGAFSVATAAPACARNNVIHVTAVFAPTPGSSFRPSTTTAGLRVSGPGTTLTDLAADPYPAVAGSVMSLTGTIVAANGAVPTGTVRATVNNKLVPSTAYPVPGDGKSTFSLPFTAPSKVRTPFHNWSKLYRGWSAV